MGAVGISTSGNSNNTPQLPQATEITSQDQIKKLQQDMGQDGYEAGDPNQTPNNKLYVKTGKAFNINAFLNSDGKTINSEHSNWNDLIDMPWVKGAIPKIDKGMKPLSESVQVSRFLDGDSLGYMLPNLGISKSNFDMFVTMLEGGAISQKSMQSLLQDVDYTHKGYTSTTYAKSHGSYGDRDVKLNMVLRKGTPAIVTNNHAENEILAGRNQKYNFTGGYKVVTLPSGKKQLVLDVYI